MSKTKISLFALAFVLTTGAAFATKINTTSLSTTGSILVFDKDDCPNAQILCEDAGSTLCGYKDAACTNPVNRN
jgi:hypothetical protein